MPERRPEFFVIDILIAIDKIKRRLAALTFDQFIADEGAVDATMRNLEIIGEATSQLLKQPEFLDKTNKEWRKIVDFRNIIVHFYFGVDFDLVFNEVVQEKISILEQNMLAVVKQMEDKTYFFQALNDAKDDLAEIHRDESIAYLEKIEDLFK